MSEKDQFSVKYIDYWGEIYFHQMIITINAKLQSWYVLQIKHNTKRTYNGRIWPRQKRFGQEDIIGFILPIGTK